MATRFLPFQNNIDKFSFVEHPFSSLPDFRFHYLPKDQANLLDDVYGLLDERRGIITIKGENGIGKTSLALRVKFQLGLAENHIPLYLKMNQKINKGLFWKFLANHCYLPIYQTAWRNRKRIIDYLIDMYGEVYIDLIIDGVEEMNSEVVSAVQELDASIHMGERLVQIILFGTPDIPNFVSSPILEKTMKPMSYLDVQRMIEYRLFVSGSPQLFSNEAIQKIYKLTEGNPRRVVNLCRTCIEVIAERGKQFVDANDIDEIAQIAGYVYPNASQNQRKIDGRPNYGMPKP
jgi:type II secretory pathway predicted ATPase ExeA